VTTDTDSTSIDPATVDFHFDLMCPYAYQTSKWIRSVRDRIELRINWRFFSLEEINLVAGKKHPWERPWSYGWSLLRIAALLRRRDPELVDRWYAEAGVALHEHGRKVHDPGVAREVVAELGLPGSLVDDALADETTHDDIKIDHGRVVDAGGYGVPTLFFGSRCGPAPSGGEQTSGEHCLFGPVLVDPPDGDAALRLWGAVTAWTEFPHLYELQRPKTKHDEQHISRTFTTYLEARDWVSINRGNVVEFTDDGFEVTGPAH
jgi:2-hydroxychromene-2-carboxylate isomerase